LFEISKMYGICVIASQKNSCKCLKKSQDYMILCENWRSANANTYSELAEWQKETFKQQ
jgi:hypothetical protein